MATTNPSPRPLSIFICYARADNQPPQGWLDRVRKQLHTMRHVELLEVASDQEIRTGQKWHDFIQEKLSRADVAVLLVSADFLASDYVRKHELPRVLKDFHGRGLQILPVLLSPVPDDGLLLRFPDPVHGPEEFNLASLQAIGTPELTLMELEPAKQVRALANLGNELSRIARELQAQAAPVRPAPVDVPPTTQAETTVAKPVLSSPATSPPHLTRERQATVESAPAAQPEAIIAELATSIPATIIHRWVHRERQVHTPKALQAPVNVAHATHPEMGIAKPIAITSSPKIILPEPPVIVVPKLEHVQGIPRPVWAERAFGEDTYGVWAEFALGKVVQRCRWIQPGHFIMGSPDSEPERWKDEDPQHEVTLSGFWLADTACTQALWKLVMGYNPSQFKDSPKHPVENVSWDDSREFFARLNALVPGLAVDFPTEAQWEYACRAGTTTPFSFGANITPEQVNYDGSIPYADASKGLDRQKTVPVASLPANAWGLFEMHGNLWEWCADWKAPYAVEPQTDPEGPPQGTGRVLRGGSWFRPARHARSAYRSEGTPRYRDRRIGLRLAPGRAAAVSSRSNGKA